MKRGVETALQKFTRRQFSVKQFQTHAGKSNDEIEKILEQESRLGILSAINYMYPFAGQSRPIIGSFGPAGHHATTDGQDPGQNKAKINHIEIELDVEDQLPLTPAMDQMMACRMLEKKAAKADETVDSDWRRSPFRKITTTDLLDNSDLEKFILIKPLILAEVSIQFSKCPILIEMCFSDIPSSNNNSLVMTQSAPKKMNLLKLDFDEDTSTEDIKTYLTDICHFLKARDFYAQGIHPGTGQIIVQPNETDDKEVICDVDSELNHIKNFSLIETETSTSVHYNNSKKIPGIIVTDANENDQLIDDLLLLDTFKSKVGDFLHDGIKNGYLNETGEIVNLDLANERRSKIFTDEFYNSFDGRLNRFVKLYDFIMENHE